MDTVMMIGRLLVSLAAVLGVMWVIARRMRRGTRGKSTRVIEVLDRTALTRSASVAVVRVGDQALVLGIADAQVSVLAETDLAAAQEAQANAASAKRPGRAGHRPVQVPAQVHATLTDRRTRPAAAAPAPVATQQTVVQAPAAPAAGPLAGSALSPQTWKQTIESLRDLTSRS